MGWGGQFKSALGLHFNFLVQFPWLGTVDFGNRLSNGYPAGPRGFRVAAGWRASLLRGAERKASGEIGRVSRSQLLNSRPKMAECSWLAILWFPFYYSIWLVSLATCAKSQWVWVTGMRWSKCLQSDSYRDNHYKHADCSVSIVIDVGHRRRLEREETQCAWKTNSSHSLPPEWFARARTEEAGFPVVLKNCVPQFSPQLNSPFLLVCVSFYVHRNKRPIRHKARITYLGLVREITEKICIPKHSQTRESSEATATFGYWFSTGVSFRDYSTRVHLTLEYLP